jgi:hypothetical protein
MSKIIFWSLLTQGQTGRKRNEFSSWYFDETNEPLFSHKKSKILAGNQTSRLSMVSLSTETFVNI